MAYEGSVELISGIKQANNGSFPLVDASAVRIDDDTRLSEFAEDVGANKADKNNPVLTGSVDGSDVTKVFVGSGAVNPGTYGTAFGVNNYYYFNPQQMVYIAEWVAGTTYKKGAIVKIPQDMSVNPPFYSFYICTYQNSDSTFNEMHWRLLEIRPAPSFAPHAFVVGNGFQDEGAVGGYGSNALTVDWTGDTRVMGDMFIGANADGTGGSKLAAMTYVNEKINKIKVYREIFDLGSNSGSTDMTKSLVHQWSGAVYTDNSRVIHYDISDSSKAVSVSYTIEPERVSITATLAPGASNVTLSMYIAETAIA